MISAWARKCFVVVLVAGTACSATGPYVWADSLPSAATNSNEGVVIQDGDVVKVRVFNQEPLSTEEWITTVFVENLERIKASAERKAARSEGADR